MRKPLQKLSHRHKLFCRKYIEHFNAAEACIAAGYKLSNSNNTPYILLREPAIKAEIARLLELTSITEAEIRSTVAEISRQRDDLTNCLRATELLAKMSGLIAPNTTQHVSVVVDSGKRTADILAKRFSSNKLCKPETKAKEYP